MNEVSSQSHALCLEQYAKKNILNSMPDIILKEALVVRDISPYTFQFQYLSLLTLIDGIFILYTALQCLECFEM